MLVDEYGVRPLLLGAKQDTPALDVIRSLAGSTCITSSAQNLQEMAALLERCHLLLCNDSGPMHVAAALGVPVLGIFAPGQPERTFPQGTGPWRMIARASPRDIDAGMMLRELEALGLFSVA
jgi:ADP-heptose:LPS heptosyltransferase